jgi:hypothetical protein
MQCSEVMKNCDPVGDLIGIMEREGRQSRNEGKLIPFWETAPCAADCQVSSIAIKQHPLPTLLPMDNFSSQREAWVAGRLTQVSFWHHTYHLPLPTTYIVESSR